MSEIPIRLREAADRAGLQNLSVISENPRKGRWCLTGRDLLGKKCFIKWNEPEKKSFYLAFQREKKIYEFLCGSGSAPEAEPLGEELLVTELMDSSATLRSVLMNSGRRSEHLRCVKLAHAAYRDFLNAVAEHAQELAAFDRSCGETFGKIEYEEQYDRHLRQLYISGPMDAPINRLERKINSFRLSAARRMVKARPVKHSDRSACRYIHGDLHLNNFMIDETAERAVLIDFEDTTEGCPEIELAYFEVQAELLLRDEREELLACRRNFDEVFSGMIDRELFESIRKDYAKAIACNRRFQK